MPSTIKLKYGSGAPSASDLVQGEPALDTVKTTCLPPPGYEIMKRTIQNSNEPGILEKSNVNLGKITNPRRNNIE